VVVIGGGDKESGLLDKIWWCWAPESTLWEREGGGGGLSY
jgi:hypothetical protein